MFRNKRDVVCTSLLGGKKGQINIAMSFSQKKKGVPKENGNY